MLISKIEKGAEKTWRKAL